MGTITILNSIEYKRQPIPEVGKEYHIFDDGKIKPSRHSIVTITDVVPFNEFRDSTIVSAWDMKFKVVTGSMLKRLTIL